MKGSSSTPARDAFIALHEFLESELNPSPVSCKGSPSFARFASEIQKEVERADRRARLDKLQDAPQIDTWARSLKTIAELREQVAHAISSFADPELAQAFYKKLENADETDLQSLLADWEEPEQDELDGDDTERI